MRRLGITLLLTSAILTMAAVPASAADTTNPTAVLDAPTTVSFGSAIPLSGIGSSDAGGGHIVEYRWTVGARPVVVTADATFTSPAGLAPGTYTVTLVVVDDAGNVSGPASATVNVHAAPTAVLDAPAIASFGAAIPLSGVRSSTDAGARVVEYRWFVGSRPVVVTADPAFNTPAGLAPGVHPVSLVVVDDAGFESAPATANVVVRDTTAPTAVLDAPSSALVNATIPLSGSRSIDIGGRVVEYRWTVAGRSVVVTAGPAFSAPGLAAGRHTVSLVVVDDAGNQSAPTTRTVDVKAPTPPPGTKLTTFGKTTLIAPVGKKTAQIDLRKGTALAGRIFSPVAVVLSSAFSAGRVALGKTTVKVPAGGVSKLSVTLSKQVRKALKGRRKLKVTVKTSARESATGKTSTTTRTLTFNIA